MDPAIVAAFVTFVHANYPAVDHKILDRFDQCHGTTHPVQGVKGGYASIVTCPGDVKTAMCVAYQVCQTCYAPDGRAYQCNCHMECTPGTGSIPGKVHTACANADPGCNPYGTRCVQTCDPSGRYCTRQCY